MRKSDALMISIIYVGTSRRHDVRHAPRQ